MKNLILASFLLTNVNATIMSDEEYEPKSACEKQDILWKEIEKTKYKKLPDYAPVGLKEVLGMARNEVKPKARKATDFAPKGWVKYLHKRGITAKVKITPFDKENTQYTGIFSGAECGLLRLSVTYKPDIEEGEPVAPGLALKVLRDNTYSANVSALYTLEGQKNDYNFFRNSLSNIVPINKGLTFRVVHYVFSTVTDYPEELGLEHMARWDGKGNRISNKNLKSPRHIFFVPNPEITKKMPSDAHDIRESISKNVPEGTILYTIYAVPEKTEKFNYGDFDYSNYKNEDIEKFKEAATPIAEITTTSPFVASSFGDTGIFYRHEVIPKEEKKKKKRKFSNKRNGRF